MPMGHTRRPHDVVPSRPFAAPCFNDRALREIYIYGGSEGGREALMMGQKFPADFDGIRHAWRPAGQLPRGWQSGTEPSFAAPSQNGGWINLRKVK